MIIKLDCRENDLRLEMEEIMKTDKSFENITLLIKSLPLGDAIVCDDDDKEILIVERKSLSDLASSIRDGRYAEQGLRLNECSIHNHAIFYLIEGDLNKFSPSKYGARPIDSKTLLSSMISISYTKGFSIYRSYSLRESALWLLQTTQKLNKIKNEFYYGDTPKQTQSYTAVANRVKKNNITPKNICEIMLSQIPGVSTSSAMAICELFPTMDVLIDAMQNNHNILSDITTTTKTGSKRRLTKTCISNIYNYLLHDTTSSISVEI